MTVLWLTQLSLMGRSLVFSLLQFEPPELFYSDSELTSLQPEFVSSQYLCNYELSFLIK